MLGSIKIRTRFHDDTGTTYDPRYICKWWRNSSWYNCVTVTTNITIKTEVHIMLRPLADGEVAVGEGVLYLDATFV